MISRRAPSETTRLRVAGRGGTRRRRCRSMMLARLRMRTRPLSDRPGHAGPSEAPPKRSPRRRASGAIPNRFRPPDVSYRTYLLLPAQCKREQPDDEGGRGQHRRGVRGRRSAEGAGAAITDRDALLRIIVFHHPEAPVNEKRRMTKHTPLDARPVSLEGVTRAPGPFLRETVLPLSSQPPSTRLPCPPCLRGLLRSTSLPFARQWSLPSSGAGRRSMPRSAARCASPWRDR